MFIGYDMFRNLAQGKHMKRKAQKEDFQKFLLDPGVLEGEVGGYSGTLAWIMYLCPILNFVPKMRMPL